MSERPDLSSNSRPTLPANPDTGSLKPEMGTGSSALATIRGIHQTNRDYTDEAVVEAIIAVAKELNLNNLSSDEVAQRIVRTFVKDSTAHLKVLYESGDIRALLEKARNQLKAGENIDLNKPFEKK